MKEKPQFDKITKVSEDYDEHGMRIQFGPLSAELTGVQQREEDREPVCLGLDPKAPA